MMIIDPLGNKIWKNTQGKIHREDGPAIIYPNGKKEWYLNGRLHRENGPAVIYPDGFKSWYLNGKLHRENGPAIIHPDGYKEYWTNGQLHCGDGPAIVYPDGKEKWYLNGRLHRENGPAVIWADGTEEYWLNGEKLTKEEFLKRTQTNKKQPQQLEGPSMEHLAPHEWYRYQAKKNALKLAKLIEASEILANYASKSTKDLKQEEQDFKRLFNTISDCINLTLKIGFNHGE